MKNNCVRLSTLAALLSTLLRTAAGTVTLEVPGTSNPWLAGMPAGTIASDDTAPAQSPVLVLGVTMVPGSAFVFSASGGVGNDNQSGLRFPPDGQQDNLIGHQAGVQNGIPNLNAPMNCLVGI